MPRKNKNYLALMVWIVALIAIGSIIGSLTQAEIGTWYNTLKRSSLTPPNAVFPVAWTMLYALLGICGWLIWRTRAFSGLKFIKSVFVTQLILNWSWTPLFFHYHLIELALLVLCVMDCLVATLIWQAYPKIKSVSLLMMPYLLWILFATYLNFHIAWF